MCPASRFVRQPLDEDRREMNATGTSRASGSGDVRLAVGGRSWASRREAKAGRLADAGRFADGKVVAAGEMVGLLEALLAPGDRVVLEGDNQKQADFLSEALAQVDAGKVHDLHLLISSLSRPEHLDLFERGIARKLDLAYAGPQSLRLAQALEDGQVDIGAIHTYVELY